MEKYQIIPRKFRPKRFAEVAGHEAVVTTLKNALQENRLGQAYLFCGGRGCGKTTLARLLAKALNCSQREDFEPCNQCESCKEITEGGSLDVIEIDGASNRGIDDIRSINETIGYAPSKGSYKIYIIDEVHMLTKEAFNALLKTLEEPPKQVKFFFATTEVHKIPPTITSRCQRFNLSRIPEKALVKKLSQIAVELKVDVEEEALIQINQLSEGSLRDAESLLDQLICYGKTPITLNLTREVFGLIASDHLRMLDEAIQTKSTDKALELAALLFDSGKDVNATVDSLLEHYRIYLLINLGNPPPSTHTQFSYTKQECLRIIDLLLTWQNQAAKTPYKRIHLEMLLVNLVRSKEKLSLDQLISRLLELEGRLSSEERSTNLPKELKATEPVPAPVAEVKIEEPVQQRTLLQKKDDVHPSKYDTLVRFAAVELEGNVKQG